MPRRQARPRQVPVLRLLARTAAGHPPRPQPHRPALRATAAGTLRPARQEGPAQRDPREPVNRDALRATAAMIQTRWPGRWEGDLARRLEQLTTRIEKGTQMNSLDTLR